MTINIQQAANVNAIGHHTSKNCKLIYCIDTGYFYASVTDAAEVLGVSVSTLSYALNNDGAKCQGKRFCFVSKIYGHLGEIAEANRIRNEKIAAYDAMIAEQNAKREAQANLAKHQANIDALRLKLEREMALMQEAQALCAN